jgi:hypothetical protein
VAFFIAVAHVLNQRFIAPVYDVVANLTAFGCAVAVSVLSLGVDVDGTNLSVHTPVDFIFENAVVLHRPAQLGEGLLKTSAHSPLLQNDLEEAGYLPTAGRSLRTTPRQSPHACPRTPDQ